MNHSLLTNEAEKYKFSWLNVKENRYIFSYSYIYEERREVGREIEWYLSSNNIYAINFKVNIQSK